MNDYRTDRDWSDLHLEMVKLAIAPYLIVKAPLVRDNTEATDLIVLRARDMTIAVRLRRRMLRYYERFPDQFTIRCQRDNGAKTELTKIVEGWGDWFFYGHAGPGVLAPWVLVNLHGLRQAFQRNNNLLYHPDGKVSGKQNNWDGTHFAWFNHLLLPDYVTIAHCPANDAEVSRETAA